LAARVRGPLAGQVALITGSSKGIGRAAAVALATAGAEVVVTGRSDRHDEGTAAATVAEVERGGGRAHGVVCDLRRDADVERLVSEAIRVFGRLDVLVNNAGVFAPAVPTSRLTVSWWDEVFDTNLRAMFLTSRLAIPLMERAGGSIVNVTSLAAEYDFPTGLVDVAYAVSKQAVNRLTVALAEELRDSDIVVNALSPVRIRSSGVRAGWGSGPGLMDYAEPEAIGPAMVFLAATRTVTGQIVRRDEFIDGRFVPAAGPAISVLFPD
jgi:3-oxoacyl-[acyl-carrier protein] reductase